MKQTRRVAAVLLMAVATTLGVSASVAADVPSADGVVNGCYKPTGISKGELLVIDAEAGQTCPAGYDALNWRTGDAVPGYEVVALNDQSGSWITVSCPAGKKAVGGGIHWDGFGSQAITNFKYGQSYPSLDGSAWNIEWVGSGTVDAYAVCLSA